MNNFRDLKVWHKGLDLALEVYRISGYLPDTEKFNLISQMQRAAVSIPSNIAEGCGRHSDASFRNFLSNALGSAYELETQCIIGNKLGYINNPEFNNLQTQIVEIQKMTFSLMNRFNPA
jgi:four helix bundle protein